MYDLSYSRPGSVSEAEEMFSRSDDAKYLAGGMTLIATMKQRLAAPQQLIDLRHIPDLRGIDIDGRRVRIGAATCHFDVSADARLLSTCPALAELAGLIGDPHVRYMGTMGGSVANNDPAADYPAGVLALDALVITNRRTITADDFFVGLFETALDEGEIITAFEFQAPVRAAYSKFPNPASRYAVAGVFVAQQADSSVRLAVTGAGSDGVFRNSSMESALAAEFSPKAIRGIAIDPGAMMSDLHADAQYRAHIVGVMARRAVAAALERDAG